MLRGPVPPRPRHFGLTSLNSSQKIRVCVKSWYQVCSILVSVYLYPSATSHALPPDWRGHSPMPGARGLRL